MQLLLELDEYVVFDFETTGLSPWGGDEVIEIAAMRILGSVIDEEKTFHTLVNPNRLISEEASNITGITQDMLVNAPTIEKVLPEFLNFCESAYLVVQNAKFDMSFLSKYLIQLKLKRVFQVYDTIALSKKYFPNEASHSLDSICHRLNIAIDPSTRHRSLGDVKITAQAFLKLKELLGGNLPPFERWAI